MKNPYLTVEACIDRLYREFLQHNRLIVAVDFDDTVFDYHNKGYTFEDTVEVLLRCQSRGFYIVIYTGSSPDKWEWQKKYLTELGITPHSINKNPIDLPFGNHGKIYFNILLDERAGLGQSIEILNKTIDKIEKK